MLPAATAPLREALDLRSFARSNVRCANLLTAPNVIVNFLLIGGIDLRYAGRQNRRAEKYIRRQPMYFADQQKSNYLHSAQRKAVAERGEAERRRI